MTSARPNGPPYFLSFAQFLAAPREGRLLDELRRLPRRPLTAEEVAATARIDEARMGLERNGIGYVAQSPGQATGLSGRKRAAWDLYQRAWEAWTALQRAMRESQQRWIYDRAVEAGVFVAPTANDDPRGDLKKEEKKDRKARDRERKKEADGLIPESVAADLGVEDAALDFAEDTVGRFYFAKHWAAHRDPAKLAAWLREHDYGADPRAVLAELDRLADAGLWRS